MFSAAKDAIASQAARSYVNSVIARYGELKELKIDSSRKTMTAVCRLQGEAETITVNVEQYAVEEAHGKHYVRVSRCTCSRPWLQNLLTDFLPGRRIELPAWAAAAVR